MTILTWVDVASEASENISIDKLAESKVSYVRI